MVLAWLGMEQLVERKISFFCVCGMFASFIITSLLVGCVIGWGLHLFDCSFLGFGPFGRTTVFYHLPTGDGSSHWWLPPGNGSRNTIPLFCFMNILPLPKKINGFSE